MSHSSRYQITIKSANQKVDDYVTDCESKWTVKRLKQHISETHVNKPNAEDQRLIYAGNLLKDLQTLEQIFLRDSLYTDATSSSKTDFTIHLVCAQKAIYNDVNKSKTTTTSTSSTTTTTTSTTRSPNNATSINSSNSTNYSQSNRNNINQFSRGSTRLSQLTLDSLNSIANNSLNNININNYNQSQQQQQQQQSNGAQSTSATISAQPSSTNNNGSRLSNDNDGQQAPVNSPQISLGANAANMFNNIFMNATGNGANVASAAASFQTTSNQHSEIVQRLMQSEQMRQQLAIFEQMANLVAAQIVNIARINSGNLLNNTTHNPISISNLNLSAASNISNTNPLNLNLNNNINNNIINNNDNNNIDINNDNNNNLNNNNNIGVARDREPFGAHLGYDEQARLNRPIGANPIHVEQQNANFDVADWVFCSFKAVAIVMMIFLHASVFRIISTLGFLGIGYVFNRIRARRAHLNPQNQQHNQAHDQQPLLDQNRRDLPANGHENGAQQADQVASPQSDNIDNNVNNDVNNNNNNDDDQQQQANGGQSTRQQQQNEIIQDRIPFLKFCYLVVTDFLASLIP